MATKMLGADGSAATFDTGAKAVMMPQLGSYLLIDVDCGLTQAVLRTGLFTLWTVISSCDHTTLKSGRVIWPHLSAGLVY